MNPFIQVVSMLPYSLRLQQRLFGADLKADLDDHQIFPYARLFKGRRGGREEERKIEIKRRRGGGVTQCRGRRMRVGVAVVQTYTFIYMTRQLVVCMLNVVYD